MCEGCLIFAASVPSLSQDVLDDLPFGVIELDEAGKVLGFNHHEEERSHLRASEVIGKNFFRDIAPCAEVKEYQGRFEEFLLSDEPSIQFDFVYRLPHATIPIRIMFVRAHGHNVLVVSREV